MQQERANELFLKSVHAFDHNLFSECVADFIEANKIKNVISDPVVQRFVAVKLNKFTKVEHELERLRIEIENRDATLRQLSDEYVEMGNQTLGYGKLVSEDEPGGGERTKLDDIAIKSALANYNKALKLCSDNVGAMLGKGRLLQTINETDAAEKEFKRILAIDGSCFDAHMALGRLYQSDGDTPAAIKSYKRAVKADKMDWRPHDALADIYETIGLDDLAETHHVKAEKLRRKQEKKSREKK